MALIRFVLLILAMWFGLGALLSLVGLTVRPMKSAVLLAVFTGLTMGCMKLSQASFRRQ
jgi:hypothetical protein